MMANGSDPNGNGYDVFLSHGSPDKPWVRALHERLTSAGIVAYLDEVAIEAGDNYVLNLSNGIGLASTFVIVVSHGTTDRPWVAHEWTGFMATHGPKSRIIPILLDHVQLPPFLRPFQAIHAIDRNVEAVAARIARAVGKGSGLSAATSTSASAPPPRPTPGLPASYTGQSLIFTIASVTDSDQLAVTSADGARRTVTAPWRRENSNDFAIALMDFERLTREPAENDNVRAQLSKAAQTVGAALFDVLISDESLRATFGRASAPGTRAVVTVQSDDDVLLSLPWELLFHESRFLVRDGVLDVVRSTTGPVQFETQLTPPVEPFTVVTHIAAPEGSALSYEAESYRITHALTDHCSQTATELGTLKDLVDTVTNENPRGIHFSGHGNPGELVFEDEEGFADRVAIERLVTELRRQGDGALPPFFFLASCHGNTPAKPAEGQSGSASSAAQLHRAGVTEVVGYYGPIGDELSTRAEEALYAAIAAGQTTRQAIAKARAALQQTLSGDGNATHRPASLRDTASAMSPARGAAVMAHIAPFAWAQLVFYRRGPEYALGTPASREKLRQREAALTRTYREVADRAFLATGFIGRRQELHQLRRRRRRGDRVFVLQGLGGLGKTTLAGHLLTMLADAEHTVNIWCRRSEGEPNQAESLVGQLLNYARARFGPAFEQVVSHVDRTAGDDAARRFGAFLEVILAQQPDAQVVVYFDNLESLLKGPDTISLEAAPDSDAFGAWRADALQRLWRFVLELTSAVKHLYVVASCRYRNDDLDGARLSVSPLADVDLFRLMSWFPALRRLSTPTRGRLAARLSGHPRAVEFLEALIAASISTWESSHGEWTAPAVHDEEGCRQEWKQLVEPVLPKVQDEIWSDLLLAALWDRVLDERAQRMLFRMTLLRRPWDDGLLLHLGDPEDDAESTRHTAETLEATSLLEQTTLTVKTREGRSRRPFYTVHAATAAFVRSRFVDAGDLVIATHLRVGTYLEEQARTSPDLTVDLEAGYHLFEAGEYNRANELLGGVSSHLRRWGRVRESLQVLLPFLEEPIRERTSRILVGRLLGTVGLAYFNLGDTRRAREFYEQQLLITREIGDRQGESTALGNLGNAFVALGETGRAVEQHEQALAISRKLGDRHSEAGDLSNLGTAYFAMGETRRVIEQQEQVLSIAREIGDRRLEGNVLGSLGNSHNKLGEHRRAIDFYKQGLVIAREVDDPRGEGATLSNLGLTYVGLGEFVRALKFFEQGLAIGRAISNPGMIEVCERGLKRCRADLSRPRQPEELESNGGE